MSATQHVDLAIIGGGCAGLSVARELIQRKVSRTVVVLEPRQHYTDDRTWSFWAPATHPLNSLVNHHWGHWAYGCEGERPHTLSSDTWRYHMVRAIDFYRHALALIDDSDCVELQRGVQVTGLSADPLGWRLQLASDDTLTATAVIDTRPPPRQRVAASSMFQCFLGAEIQLADDRPALDVDTIELMTDMATTDQGFRFSYVLPFASRRALVELTYFAPKPLSQAELEPQLGDLLSQRGWQAVTVLRTEYGVLPMGLPDCPAKAAPTLVVAGTSAGALRPASGYGFLRIQRWAKACAERYTDTGQLCGQAPEPWRQRHMDRLFLRTLRGYPQLAPTLFHQLLSRCPNERFIRFMSDQATWLDSLAIIGAMPKKPFIRTLLTPSKA
jgi:lycopene beta-cyclase